MAKANPNKLNPSLPYVLIVGSLIGFLASFILTIDTINFLKDPSYSPVCNINPIISCVSIMKTDQSSVFGFTNSLLGIGAFSALSAFGLALLAGARFARWLWWLVQAQVTFSLLFVHWLIFESLYRIGSLCPFCMAVWAVTIPIFWNVTLFNLRQSKFRTNKYVLFINKHHGDILLLWFLIIIGLILKRFWYYWSTFI